MDDEDYPEENLLLVMITAANEAEALNISKTLVEERLIACANQFPVRSIFSWEGKIENASEIMLLCKSKESIFDHLLRRVQELHSYDVPEIIAIPITAGSEDYLGWVDDSTRDE